jgi:hypothetical protein
VPGNLPIGCSAVYMTLFGSPNKADYDPTNGCLKAFNGFSKYHNNQLKLGLQALREKYPHARIIYADYYGAAKRFFHAPRHYGAFYTLFFHSSQFYLKWENYLICRVFSWCVCIYIYIYIILVQIITKNINIENP